MLAEIYIETLLLDSELADLVSELWNIGMILDELVAFSWSNIVSPNPASTAEEPLALVI